MSQNILQPALDAIIEEEIALRGYIFPAFRPKPGPKQDPTPPATDAPAAPVGQKEENPAPAVASEPVLPAPEPKSRSQAERARKKAKPTYHRIKCTICSHPEREAIEQAILHWRSPSVVAHEFGITHRTAIYRHARAQGLFEQRASEMKYALGLIIEKAEGVQPTANSIIRAVRAYSCLDDNGRWTDPPKRLIITYEEPSDPSSTPKSIATHAEQESV